MALPGCDQILTSSEISREVFVVVREEPDAGDSVKGPASDLTRRADFRLERPTVVAEVDELRGLVLTKRRHDGQASTDHELASGRARKFRNRQRRRALQAYGKLE